ncbi:MAG TPA: hypothetical protein VKB18_10645 [Gemmatimonadota bacterium]|nr:hypothetical protein [Gemmatimonadota bacterium]
MRAAARGPGAAALAGVALAVLALSATACGRPEPGAAGSDQAAPAAAGAAGALPDTVVLREPGLYPEGIEYDAGSGRFLASSVTRGSVTCVADDGSHGILVADTASPSAVGLHVAGGRLYVARADVAAAFDSTVEGRARLGVYDLASGRPLYSAELGPLAPGGRHFANDVAVDGEGNAYITDSLSPVVYRVAADGAASVFARDTLLGGGFGLNGIELESPDGWRSARVAARAPLDAGAGPTSVALRDGAPYVLLSHLGRLGDEEPASTFELVRVLLDGGA